MRFVHFADDATVFASDSNFNIANAYVNRELVVVDNWLKENLLLSMLAKLHIWYSPTKKMHGTELYLAIQFLLKLLQSNSNAFTWWKSYF